MRKEIEAMMTEDQKEDLKSMKEEMEPYQQDLLDQLASLALESKTDSAKLKEFNDAKRELEVVTPYSPLGNRTVPSLKLVEKFHVGIEAYYGCESLLEELEARMPSEAEYLGRPASKMEIDQQECEETSSNQSMKISVFEENKKRGQLHI